MDIPTISGNLTDREKVITNSSNISITVTIDDLNHEKFMRKLPVLLYMVILMIIGLPGNFSVLFVFLRHYKRSTYRKFVVTLAFVDIVSCSVCMPFEIIETIFLYTFHASEICKIIKTLTASVLISSSLIIIGLSVDRYRHLCQPFKIQMSENISTVICVSSIALAFLLALPCYLLSGIRNVNLMNNITGSNCYIISEEYISTDYPFYYLGVGIFIFITSIVSLIIMYILIGRAIYKQAQFRKKFCPTYTSNSKPRKDMANESMHVSGRNSIQATTAAIQDANSLPNTHRPNSSNHQSKQKITKVAFAISALYIISFLPYTIAILMTLKAGDFVADTMSVASIILSIMSGSVFLNSVGNPIIYGFFDKRFRGFFRKYMCVCRAKSQLD